MKNTALIIIVLLLFACRGAGQPVSAIKAKLIANHLIEAADTDMLIITDADGYAVSTGAILSALSTNSLLKSYQERVELESKYKSGIPRLQKAQQDSANKIWIDYLSRLRSAGLIYPQAYDADRNDILHGSYRYVDEMLEPLILRQLALEFWSAKSLSPPLDSLYRNGLFGQKNYQKLMSDAAAFKINSATQIIAQLDHAVTISLSSYHEKDTTALVAHVFREVAGLVPDLNIQDFAYRIDWLHHWRLSSDKHPVTISFTANGRHYSGEDVIYTDIAPENQWVYSTKINPDAICPLLNQVLADVKSPIRLSMVSAARGNKYDTLYDPSTFTIIALTSRQHYAFGYHQNYFHISEADYQSHLTVREVKAYIDTFSQIGLLDHLSPEALQRASRAAIDTSVRYLVSLIHFFPDLVYTLDTRERPADGPYGQVLLHLKALSHGAFACDTPKYDFSKTFRDTLGVSFSVAGHAYRQELKHPNGYFDRNFFATINQAVVDAHLPGRFYYIAACDAFDASHAPSTYRILYLSPRQKEFLETHHIFYLSLPE